jgi:uncharacterized protein (TIGR02996 family)
VARFERGDDVFEITSNESRYKLEMRTHLREGWRRVYDPRCETPLGAEPMDPVLEAGLRADPEDIGAALVYADWLQQRGHPRGALIAVQHRLSSDPNNTILLDEERRLFRDSGDALLSRTLQLHVAVERGTQDVEIARNVYDGGVLAFDHGFLRKAELVLRQRGADEDLLWDVLRHPSARVMGTLSITVENTHDAQLVAALLTHGPRPLLRHLTLRVEDELGAVSMDLSNLDVAYPQLESFVLAVNRVRFGELRLPRLASLTLETRATDLPRIIAAGSLPALERLTVWHPEPKLVLEGLPKLREITFAHTTRALEVTRAVVSSPHVTQLEKVTLDCALPMEAVTMLVDNRARFPALRELRVQARANEIDRLRDAGFTIAS